MVPFVFPCGRLYQVLSEVLREVVFAYASEL